jgi:hypothetical protein
MTNKPIAAAGRNVVEPSGATRARALVTGWTEMSQGVVRFRATTPATPWLSVVSNRLQTTPARPSEVLASATAWCLLPSCLKEIEGLRHVPLT